MNSELKNVKASVLIVFDTLIDSDLCLIGYIDGHGALYKD